MTEQELHERLNHMAGDIPNETHLAFLTAAAFGKEKTVMKKKLTFSLVCAITILLIGTMTALAAGVEDINAMLYKLWPEAARALRPLNLSVEKAGIRLDVISATLTDDHLLITYSLTDTKGDRINENTRCAAIIELPLVEECFGSDEMLSFDADTHQAIYASYYKFTTTPLSEDGLFDFDSGTISFTVNGLMSPMQTKIDLWPLMIGQDYSVEAVPAPPESGPETMVRDLEAADTEKTLPNILNPENNLHIPITDDIELSGIGWIEGNLHVQIHVSNYSTRVENEYGGISDIARYTSYINLLDQDGNSFMRAPGLFTQLLKDKPYFIWGLSWRGGRNGDEQWIEKIFPVQPEEMNQYVLYGEFTDLRTNLEDLLQYDWRVSFPSNLIQIEENE